MINKHLTITDIARATGWDMNTLYHAIRVSGALPEPTHSLGRRRLYYTQEEAQAIVDRLAGTKTLAELRAKEDGERRVALASQATNEG